MHHKDSVIISLLRFPMIVGIVLIHSGIELSYKFTEYPIYDFLVNRLIIGSITRVCVPLFFMISGYLFFYHIRSWNMKTYIYKLKRRTKSLLTPYFLWNSLAICLFAIMAMVFHNSQSGATPPVQLWDYKVVASLYWAKQPDNIPIVPQFWFIRNLMVIVLITPLIHWLINKLGILFIAILGLLWGVHICEYSIPGTMGLFFFSLGAYFSIRNDSFYICFKKNTVLGLVYPILLVADLVSKDFTVFNIYIHNLGILSGIVFVINIVGGIISKFPNIKPQKMLLSSTFFVFAAHEPYMGKFKTLCYHLLPQISPNHAIADIQFVIYYFVIAILWIVILVSLYGLLQRCFPNITNVFCGGR